MRLPLVTACYTIWLMAKAGNIDRLVGARLAALREEHGLTQLELARAADMDFVDYVSVEAGVRRCGAGELFMLTRALGISVSKIFRSLEPPVASGTSEGAEEV